jgi:hypothetical protein
LLLLLCPLAAKKKKPLRLQLQHPLLLQHQLLLMPLLLLLQPPLLLLTLLQRLLPLQPQPQLLQPLSKAPFAPVQTGVAIKKPRTAGFFYGFGWLTSVLSPAV